MLYDRPHYGWTDCIADHPNPVAAGAMREVHSAHAHRSLKLRHLQHPHHVAVLRIWLNQCEAAGSTSASRRQRRSRNKRQGMVSFCPAFESRDARGRVLAWRGPSS